jgi:hypothetical protein
MSIRLGLLSCTHAPLLARPAPVSLWPSRLSLVTEMTKHIRVRASGGTHDEDTELAAFTPAFLWLLRDFYLRLEEDGHAVGGLRRQAEAGAAAGVGAVQADACPADVLADQAACGSLWQLVAACGSLWQVCAVPAGSFSIMPGCLGVPAGDAARLPGDGAAAAGGQRAGGGGQEPGG